MDFHSNENEVLPMTSRSQMARVAHCPTLYLFPVNQNTSFAMACRVASHMYVNSITMFVTRFDNA